MAVRLYDVSRKYRVVCAVFDLLDYADTLAAARLIAGEWQIERDERYVQIVRQQGLPKRWKATLEPSGRVRLDALYSDGFPDDPAEWQSRRARAMAKQIDKQRRRRKRRRSARQQAAAKLKRARAERFGSANKRGVVCLDESPPRPFGRVKDAAEWAGVRDKTVIVAIRTGRRAGGFRFEYADVILQRMADDEKRNLRREGTDEQLEDAARRAIREASRRRGRDSGEDSDDRGADVPEQPGQLQRQGEVRPAAAGGDDGARAVRAPQGDVRALPQASAEEGEQ